MSKGSYAPVVFDIDDPSNDLAFQDFNTHSIPSDRLSPQPGTGGTGLFEPDREMAAQVGGKGMLDLESYTGYFDVDTQSVLARCTATFLPPYHSNYLSEVLEERPDLYGPFWVPTTVAFVLFVTVSLSTSVQAYNSGVEGWTYDFGGLSLGIATLYTYALGVPVVLWAAMRYWASIMEISPVSLICIYGYSTTIWIFTSLLCIPPFPWVRLSVTLLSAAISGFFLARNLYPILATAENGAKSKPLLVLILGAHAVLGIVLYAGFFGVQRFDLGEGGDGNPALM
ncbi:Yip1-domain-containing protein [Atractiella rhizophila]|nr:Yip1-domain-containing protein [Atractiella rhizophila]